MSSISSVSKSQVPTISVSQMMKIDELMVKDFGISIQMMMEHASRETAHTAQHALSGDLKGKKVLILSGKGNNGGDGIGAARFIHNLGGIPTITLTAYSDQISPDSQNQLSIVKSLGIEVLYYSADEREKTQKLLKDSDLIIDALIGYSLKGNPRDPIASLIRMSNESKTPILAIDIPSGLTGDKGKPSNPTIKARWTVTLGLPKKGLYRDSAKKFVGELYIADLSIPSAAYSMVGIDYQNLFTEGSLVSVADEQ